MSSIKTAFENGQHDSRLCPWYEKPRPELGGYALVSFMAKHGEKSCNLHCDSYITGWAHTKKLQMESKS